MFSVQNGPLLHTNIIDNKREFFFDRNPRPFSVILDFYRTGRVDLMRPFDYSLVTAEEDVMVLQDINTSSGFNTMLNTPINTACEERPPTTAAAIAASRCPIHAIGLAELRSELDYFQIPDTINPLLLPALHASAAGALSIFADTLFDVVAIHINHFIDIVVIHFERGDNYDRASLRNVNRSVGMLCAHLLEKLRLGFRLLSDEKLVGLVRDLVMKRFGGVRFTVQMVRHELLVLCLSGYLDVDLLRKELGLE